MTEVRFNGRSQRCSTFFKQDSLFLASKCTLQRRKSEQTGIRQRRGTEIGVTRREAVFQLIGIGCNDTGCVLLSLAVFRTPFKGGKQFFCNGTVTRRQRITGYIAASPRSPAPFQ